MAAFSSPPLKNPYDGRLTLQNNGTTAKNDQTEQFDPTSHVQTRLVNNVGTHVNVPMPAA
ncbi:hypothetical protein EES43_00275 [Streptomyces sp. ADI96-02]|uniref:hypothetical protein n=1 Tax=unclassified Streptomyces TaxID=2593676 RepID=UPI000F559582|nr:hypothetical protein [Streptomyces sp. ADI96-02]RPK69238.1 hypothetical protein EES43_00275 [Streptomyces sp. ADI96-02]